MKMILLNQSQTRLLKFGLIGTFCLCLSYTILVIDPLDLIIQDKLSVYDGSFLYKIWQKPPLEVFVSVYVFNVTNVDRFLSGADPKLKLEQVGPYVYQEFLENRNAVFNENGTLTFSPVRTVIPIPERSVGDPRLDKIMMPNIPFIGISTAIQKMNFLASFAMRHVISPVTQSEPFVNLTVYDFLWGYEDSLISLAHSVNIVPFEKFGILDRMFDDGENEVTINLPARKKFEKEKKVHHSEKIVEQTTRDTFFDFDDFDNNFIQKRSVFNHYEHEDTYEPVVRDYSIDTWNGSPGFEHWGYTHESNTPCNTLRGAYDGTLFPQNISQNEIFHIYRKAFCRTLPITYSHAGRLFGLDAYWFTLADNAFESDLNDPESSCYCEEDKCLKKGLGNITPCYYKIPLAVSLPHFYRSDPTLLDGVEGMKPDPEKHESEIIMQPNLGVPIRVRSRMQINLLVEKSKDEKLKKFEDIVVPIIWVEMAIEELTPYLRFLLNFLFNVAPYAQTAIICLLCLIGISLYAVAVIAFCFIPKSSDGYRPKRSIRYSAIYMVPEFLKKEMDKLAEKEDDHSDIENA